MASAVLDALPQIDSGGPGRNAEHARKNWLPTAILASMLIHGWMLAKGVEPEPGTNERLVDFGTISLRFSAAPTVPTNQAEPSPEPKTHQTRKPTTATDSQPPVTDQTDPPLKSDTKQAGLKPEALVQTVAAATSSAVAEPSPQTPKAEATNKESKPALVVKPVVKKDAVKPVTRKVQAPRSKPKPPTKVAKAPTRQPTNKSPETTRTADASTQPKREAKKPATPRTETKQGMAASKAAQGVATSAVTSQSAKGTTAKASQPTAPPVLFQASFRSAPTPPRYPRVARRRGWEGTVQVRILIDQSGEILAVRLHESSGRPVLDKAALAGVKRWHFKPAIQNGTAIRAWVQIPVYFSLRS